MGVHENKIQESLKELRMDAVDFALLAKINRTILSAAFRGRHNFSGPESLRLLDLIDELKALADDAFPFHLSFKDPAHIERLLDMRKEGIRVFCQFGPIEKE